MKLKNSTFRNVIDTETGEIRTIEESKTFFSKMRAEPFYFAYIEHMQKIFNITKESDKRLLVYMCSNMTYNKNEITLDVSLAKVALDISASEISRSLRRLLDLNVISLHPNSKKTYIINPTLFWKGDASTRDRLLRGFEISFKLVLDEKVED